jgi:hypothetical protein
MMILKIGVQEGNGLCSTSQLPTLVFTGYPIAKIFPSTLCTSVNDQPLYGSPPLHCSIPISHECYPLELTLKPISTGSQESDFPRADINPILDNGLGCVLAPFNPLIPSDEGVGVSAFWLICRLIALLLRLICTGRRSRVENYEFIALIEDRSITAVCVPLLWPFTRPGRQLRIVVNAIACDPLTSADRATLDIALIYVRLTNLSAAVGARSFFHNILSFGLFHALRQLDVAEQDRSQRQLLSLFCLVHLLTIVTECHRFFAF